MHIAKDKQHREERVFASFLCVCVGEKNRNGEGDRGRNMIRVSDECGGRERKRGQKMRKKEQAK